MKSLFAPLALASVLSLPMVVMAKPVNLNTTLNSYGGDGAYLALYLTDAAGGYRGALRIAGGKSKYYEHLRDWRRASGGKTADIAGITGASVGAGRSLKITVDLADALIDAGYQLHIDVAVEDMPDSPSEVVVPLTSAGAGQPVAGRRYVRAFSYVM